MKNIFGGRFRKRREPNGWETSAAVLGFFTVLILFEGKYQTVAMGGFALVSSLYYLYFARSTFAVLLVVFVLIFALFAYMWMPSS